MRRLLKPGAGLVAIAGVVLALTAAVGAVGPFDPFDDPNVASPVQLCVGTKTVVAPTGGACPRNTTLVEVADSRVAEDLRVRIESLAEIVQAEAGARVALEQEVANLDERLDGVEPTLIATQEELLEDPPDFVRPVTVRGTNLEPGSTVIDCPSNASCHTGGPVLADGTYTGGTTLNCGLGLSVYFVATDKYGNEITSNTVAADC